MSGETDRIDNRYDAAAGLIGAAEASRRLGVKRSTLYTYVSRGLVRCVPTGGRRRLYVADDVDRLAARSAARRGHAAVAVGALRWGEPVLDSAITSIDGGILRYRGRDVVELVEAGVPFERVAALLWEAAPDARWPAAEPTAPASTDPGTPLVWRMVRALPTLALADPSRHGAAETAEHARARRLVSALASALGARSGTETDGLAARVAAGLTGSRQGAALVNAMLVASADHELNASTFTARVAASSGADLYACVGAALYTFTGPRHGAAGDRVEALVDACERGGALREVRARLSRGEALPGFGHPLYPDGDPRARPLIALARERSEDSAPLRRLLELVDAVESETGQRPAVDLAGVAIAYAIGAPPGAGSALFGLGRTAGWIAHVLEQRQRPELLRPRARYVGR